MTTDWVFGWAHVVPDGSREFFPGNNEKTRITCNDMVLSGWVSAKIGCIVSLHKVRTVTKASDK